MSNQVERQLYTILATLGAIFFVYFAIPFVATQNAYQHSKSGLQNVIATRGEMPHTLFKKAKSQMDETSVRAAEYEEHLARGEGYQRLMVKNPDMIGWVRVEGTSADYPVIQALGRPDYCYRRRFDREYLAYNMIYMDAVCTTTEEETASPSYILYGRHMKNGSMSASLEQYDSEKYYKEHPFVEFDMKNEFGSYEIVGVARLPATQLNDEFTTTLAAKTEGDCENLVRYVKEHTFYRTGVDAQQPEQLLALAACEYTQKDGRLLMVTRKKQG